MNQSAAENHFLQLKRWMTLEAEAEKVEALQSMQRASAEEAEAAGNSLVHLAIREQDAGLGGRVLWTLAKRNQSLALPWTRLGVGSPVLLSEEGRLGSWRGVISRINRERVQVAFAQWPEPESEQSTFRLDHASDEISRQRQQQALDRAASAQPSRLADLRDVLLGLRAPEFRAVAPLVPLNGQLNASQVEAVQFVLSAEDVAIVHGPPGTGKTTTLVEVIRQLIRQGQRVLVTAPSNLAVDHVMEQLLAVGEKALRLGHPARVTDEVQAFTLDLLVENHPDVRLAHKMIREAYALRDQAGKFRRARPEPGMRQALRQEARQMIAEARELEDQVVERLLGDAKVVCATTTGLDREFLKGQHFDWCVLDEASQSTEPGAWIPLQFADRLVLAGDPFQLPPTVISTQAAAEGFKISLLERLMKVLGPQVSRRLTVQYRMSQEIMAFSSREFYEDSLVADPTAAARRLADLPGVAANELTETAVHFVDTAGASYDEAVEAHGESRFNPMEARLVEAKVQALFDAGVSPAEIAIISPYSAQVRLLRERLKRAEIEVDSVDGFQGREKEVVIVSLVRSNRDGEIGFLEDVRRMNVALTRARRKLIVIGDSATVTVHPFYQRMVDYFEAIGAYHSVWEEPEL